ncbi:MAG TPA: hypothetical protein V6D09_00300 [Leptolyngbyaceae cyanobacterium]
MQARVIKNQPPLLLVATATAIAIAVLMPLTYLVMRTASISGEQLLMVSRPRTLQVLLNSAGIAIATPLFSAAIAVPLAFLTWRTDLTQAALLANRHYFTPDNSRWLNRCFGEMEWTDADCYDANRQTEARKRCSTLT